MIRDQLCGNGPKQTSASCPNWLGLLIIALKARRPAPDEGRDLNSHETSWEPHIRVDSPLTAACRVALRHLSIDLLLPPEGLLDTTPEKQIEAICMYSGARVRRIDTKYSGWLQAIYPTIAFKASSAEPVVVMPSSIFGEVRIYDLTNKRERSLDQLDTTEGYQEAAYACYPILPSRVLTYRDLLSLSWKSNQASVVIVIITSLLSSSFSLFLPLIARFILRRESTDITESFVVWCVVGVFAVTITGSTLTMLRSMLLLRIGTHADSMTQSAIWDRILRLPISFFRGLDSATLGQCLGDIPRIYNIAISSAGSLIAAVFGGIALLAYIAYTSLTLFWIAVGLNLVIFSFSWRYWPRLVTCRIDILDVRARLSRAILGFVVGIEKLKGAGAEARAFKTWLPLFVSYRGKLTALNKISRRLDVISGTYPALSLLALYIVLARHNALKASDPRRAVFISLAVAFFQLISFSIVAVTSLLSASEIHAISRRSQLIFDACPESLAGKNVGELSGKVQISNVCFSYEGVDKPILRNISLTVEPGAFIGIVGASGSGKSTLLRLLLGFEKPTVGLITYDDEDLPSLSIRSVRSQCGVVLQGTAVFRGTILSNVVGGTRYGLPEAWDALHIACLAEEVQKMPMGVYTFIGDGGMGLSGGQRQRLMIARAVIGRPRLLLLDEATSSLDNLTQAKVSANLRRLQMTRIQVAHRLSTLIYADNIYVMSEGNIVGEGTYLQLQGSSEIFRLLTCNQTAEEPEELKIWPA